MAYKLVKSFRYITVTGLIISGLIINNYSYADIADVAKDVIVKSAKIERCHFDGDNYFMDKPNDPILGTCGVNGNNPCKEKGVRLVYSLNANKCVINFDQQKPVLYHMYITYSLDNNKKLTNMDLKGVAVRYYDNMGRLSDENNTMYTDFDVNEGYIYQPILLSSRPLYLILDHGANIPQLKEICISSNSAVCWPPLSSKLPRP